MQATVDNLIPGKVFCSPACTNAALVFTPAARNSWPCGCFRQEYADGGWSANCCADHFYVCVECGKRKVRNDADTCDVCPNCEPEDCQYSDLRPRCIRCTCRWLPPEGVDATNTPCPACSPALREYQGGIHISNTGAGKPVNNFADARKIYNAEIEKQGRHKVTADYFDRHNVDWREAEFAVELETRWLSEHWKSWAYAATGCRSPGDRKGEDWKIVRWRGKPIARLRGKIGQ